MNDELTVEATECEGIRKVVVTFTPVVEAVVVEDERF